MATFPMLEHCSTKRVITEDEFTPSDKPHKSCMFTTIMFNNIDYDYMETSHFDDRYGQNDKYIAITVNKICPHCGAPKVDEYGDELTYRKVVTNTEENRRRFKYDYEPIEDPEE